VIPTSNHNEALSGDILYSAFLNYEWREIVLPFVIRGMEQIAAAIEDESDRQDFEALYGAMIDDFYNEEIPVTEELGSIKLWGGMTIPTGWMHCDGQSLSETTYADLFAVIGHNFGSAGAGFFNLPATGFRFILGVDDLSEINEFGGAATHTLTIDEMPAHTHTVGAAAGTGAQARAARGNSTSVGSFDSGSQGSGAAHNNMPPYRRLAYIIKVLP